MSKATATHIQSYHPTTFLERGVAVPFTTPMLAGTRARPMERAPGQGRTASGGNGEKASGVELIVPNPSGAAGAYILPWNAVRDLCRPTVHDMLLNEHVAALPTVSPSGIRQAARSVAADGLAGKAAREAAAQATAADQQDRLLTNFLMLLELVKQGEAPGQNATPPDREQPALLERRAKHVIATIAPRLQLSAEQIALGLEQLAGVFARLGIGRHIPESRISRTTDALMRIRDETLHWSTTHSDDSAAQATMIADVAGYTLTCADRVTASARILLDDLPLLLRHWTATPASIAQRAVRPEWLLDGWEQICLVWELAQTDQQRRAALSEMSLMVPIIPREVTSWMETTSIADDHGRLRRIVRINEDWRTGVTVLDLIARNERLRALAA